MKILVPRNGHGTMVLAFGLNKPFTHFLSHCIILKYSYWEKERFLKGPIERQHELILQLVVSV